MKPSPPRPPSAAEALLEAGREHPPLRYDVEAGLLRHQQHVQSGAPLPAWASARGALPGGSLALRVAKLVLAGAVVVGPLVVALWPAQEPAHVPAPAPSAASAPPAASTAPAPVASAPAAPSEAPAPEPAPERRLAHAAARSARPRPELRAPRREETAAAVATPDPPAESASSAPAARAPGVLRVASRATPEAEPQSRDSDEVRELALAERLLARDPRRALELARKGDARFPAGYLRQERAYVAIMALIELGASAQARAEAERFFARYPDTPYGAQIRRALAQGAADGGVDRLTR